MRPKDHLGEKVDNTAAFDKLIEALEQGDAITLFPEGISRYHPEVAPLKTGVARIASDTLTRNKSNPDFELTIVTCSVTYLHREMFRSSLLVSFNPPITLRPGKHPDLLATEGNDPRDAIKRLTKDMEEQIRGGTLDAPSWEILRIARTAQRLYAPLGTRLSLGEYVRLNQRFVDLFAHKVKSTSSILLTPKPESQEFNLEFTSSNNISEGSSFAHTPDEITISPADIESIDTLAKDLKEYQNALSSNLLKDDRIRTSKYLKTRHLYWRLLVRSLHTLLLGIIALPGLIFWIPIFVVAGRQGRRTATSGPLVDVYDEVAQTKLLYGLGSGLVVYFMSLGWSYTFSVHKYWMLFTSIGVPLIMWFTLRWIEDMLSAARSARSIFRMLVIGRAKLEELRVLREDLLERVMEVAVKRLGLPRDAEELVASGKGGGLMRRRLGYFSVRRRRKKDWNEVLRTYDVTEYAE